MTKRIYGSVEGVSVGDEFDSREQLSKAGVHRPTQAGICGTESDQAESIVVSGGYEDDEDWGDEIIYTGHGGNIGKKQVEDQQLTKGNLALAKNKSSGIPIRVVRGARAKTKYSPQKGYRYDGLFRVADYWKDLGKSGFLIWRFRLEKVGSESVVKEVQPDNSGQPTRKKYTIQRIVRDTAKSRKIKNLYSFTCQICETQLLGPNGPYAEAAHIKPLGRPHNGPDMEGNLICLCPNHHVLFDIGAFTINDDLTLNGASGKLKRHSEHAIDVECLSYRREKYGLISLGLSAGEETNE